MKSKTNKQILESPLLAMGKRYVFYTSLLSEYSEDYQKLGKYAQQQINHFSSTLSMTGENQGGEQIMQAINFLKDSAEFERQKELNFFQHYTTKHPEIQKLFKTLTPTAIQNDYTDFIVDINRAIKGTEELKKMVHSEYKRITENRAAADDYFCKSKDIKKLKDQKKKEEYERDLQIDKNIQYTNNARTFFRQAKNGDASFFNATFGGSDPRHIKSVLANTILENYGAKLFSVSPKGVTLDAKQRDALIAILTMKANELFITDFTNIDINITKAENIIQSTGFQKMVDNILDSPDLINLLDSFSAQYGMKFGDYTKINTQSNKITRLEKAVEISFNKLSDEEKKGLDYDEWRKKHGLTKNDIRKMIAANETIRVQTYYVGEDISLVDWIINGLSGILGGGKNPTDDIEAGTLITTAQYDKTALNQLEQQLWESQARHFKKVGATSTLESFLNNTEELMQARKEQELLIKDFIQTVDNGKNGLNDMLAHINIHSTVKGYESAGSYTFEKEGGFGGAAFGSTLDSELKIIDSMAQAGGLSSLDINNLFIAMINCGKLMIGQPLKHTIENYFSAFMGMLMFNDANLFAQDVKLWLSDKTQLGSVQDLHMYQLNGLVVPSSYILQETYNAMSKLQTMDEKYRGVRAVFKTDDAQPIMGDWQATSERAIEKTKLERMHFLAGFVDLLEDIENRLNSL